MSPEHRFMYSARELRDVLTKLLDFLEQQIRSIEPRVIEARKMKPVSRSLAAPASEPEVMAAQLVQQDKHLRFDRDRASLWRHECERLPFWKKFSLTEDELRWLYRFRGGQA